ncbi:hypothetical protein B0H12DRAFT_43339 [Mycena haematopus]|nr:hypothetical protein B0H12DRAFT_43339 [Mycena haematopus]
MPNSWIRYDSHRSCSPKFSVRLWWSPTTEKCWLAQANHIFTQLPVISHREDYVCVDTIWFILQFFPNIYYTRKLDGHLFICPPEDFRTGANSFQWPKCPAYWSLDRSGAVRLSQEDAKSLGFPILHIETVIRGRSWDKCVYDELRRFHHGKGFDLDSQPEDVAEDLDYPLFELAKDADGPQLCKEGWVDCKNETELCWKLGHYAYE